VWQIIKKIDQTYLVRNLFGGATETRNINTKYLYRADGAKMNKLYTYGSVKNQSEVLKITEYFDGFQYETQGSSLRMVRVLKFVPTAEGYYNFENNKYIYSYVDHLDRQVKETLLRRLRTEFSTLKLFQQWEHHRSS